MKKIALIAFLFAVCAFADKGKAPQYRAARVHGIGNAFVAVADNKYALYYNPAGLNLIDRLGNFEKNPDMGYMPRNKSSDMNVLAFSYSFSNNMDGIFDLKHALEGDDANLDSIGTVLREFDREYLASLDFFQMTLLEYTRRNFGLSFWINTSSIGPYMDMGVFIPSVGYNTFNIDGVIQSAFAFSPVDKWSIGIGGKAVQRRIKHGYEAHVPSPNSDSLFNNDAWGAAAQDAVDEFLDDLSEFGMRWGDFAKPSKYNLALDFGVLYQIHREVRLGASLRDIYFSELEGQSITPNLSLGAMTSPMILQSNSWFERKVHFAADYVDILNVKSGMFFSHLNFGAEIDQVVLPSPTRDMSYWPQVGYGLLGAVIGCGLGYFVGGSIIKDRLDYLEEAAERNKQKVSDNKEKIKLPYKALIGSVAGGLLGTAFGWSVGNGDDVLRVSFGGGFEGGYWSATGAIRTPIPIIGSFRMSSYAEEMGERTGQKENRYYLFELGNF